MAQRYSACLEIKMLRVRASPASLPYVLEQDTLISTGSTQEDLSQQNQKIADWEVQNQIKQTK